MNTKATKAGMFIPQLKRIAHEHGLNIKNAAHFKLCRQFLDNGIKSN
jgi:hypothetical protein